MNLPQFNAEASLGPSIGIYRANALSSRSGRLGVLAALGTTCGNCETVGGFGGIRGAGRRSCCREVYNPITKRIETSCWFESCAPGLATGGLLSF
jgi:hypothetical protein